MQHIPKVAWRAGPIPTPTPIPGLRRPGGRPRAAAPWRRLPRLFALRSERASADESPQPALETLDQRAADTAPSATPSATPGATPSATGQRFEAFYRQHERDIFGYLWRMTGDEQTANDLTQDVFLRAWREFEKVQRYERPGGWLFRVATNLALNERRHQRVVGPAASLRGHERAAGDHAAQIAERTALRNALASLPAQQRAAFILRELYGHSCDEVAEALGLTRAAAKMTLSRARERLRTLYLREDAE